ncbi:MAG: hypothetical protein ACREOM_13865, partial [Candidatus Dormibacteraceae bacterium]
RGHHRGRLPAHDGLPARAEGPRHLEVCVTPWRTRVRVRVDLAAPEQSHERSACDETLTTPPLSG